MKLGVFSFGGIGTDEHGRLRPPWQVLDETLERSGWPRSTNQ